MMAFSTTQFMAETSAQNEAHFRNQMDASKQMQSLAEQAADDALFRTAQNNAMAKVKGMSKLAEAANQLS
jgi:DNA-binding phage protein